MLIVSVTILLFLNAAIANCSTDAEQPNISSNCTTTTLRLLVLLPCYREFQAESSHVHVKLERCASWDYLDHDSILPVLDLAVEQINNRSDFLSCHKLELVHKEAGCEITTSTLVGLTSGLFPSNPERRGVIGVIGPTCSLSALQASTITNHPEVQMVLLHSSSSSLLTNREKYPLSLGILGSTASIVNLLVALTQKSGWHNIAILYDPSDFYYHSLMREFLAALDEDVNINFLSSVTSNFYPLDEVKIVGTRIVFVFTHPGHSYRIMCLAYNTNLVYPRYQWIFVNKRLGDFLNAGTSFTYRGRYYTCSNDLVSGILKEALLIDYQFSTTNLSNVTNYPQGINLKEIQQMIAQTVTQSKFNQNISKDTICYSIIQWMYSILYDTVWAWGMVLHELTKNQDEINQLVFRYRFGNKTLTQAILRKFYSLDFQGMSGRIRFNADIGVVDRLVNLYQITDGQERHIASANSSTVTVVASQDLKTIHDVARVVALPHIGIVAFFLFTHCVELFIVILLHLLTFLYRNTKFVKASSPKLVQPAFIGVYFFIAGMMLYTIFFANKLNEANGTLFCQAVWVWLFPISFTLVMGITILRAWRLYRIFKHYMNPGKFISNHALLGILSILVLFDVVIAIVWTISDPFHFQFVEYKIKSGQTYDLIIDQSCVSTHDIIPLWIGTVFTYKIGLLIAMVVLSVLTHQIPNQTFSTTLLRVFSYIYSISFAIGFSIYYLFVFFDPQSNIDFYILSVLLSVLLLSFVILVILPPLLPVIKIKLKIF